MMSRRPLAAATLAMVLAAAGCDGSGTPKRKDTDLLVKTQADAEQLVKTLADAVAQDVGSPLEKWKTQPAPCTDAPGPWNLSGVANVAVAPGDQVATLTRLRDAWTRQGYEITQFHLVPPDNKEGRLSARIPADQLTVTLQSTAPRTAFAIIITTPCYQPAPGEDPGNG